MARVASKRPEDVSASVRDATGAALKALQMRGEERSPWIRNWESTSAAAARIGESLDVTRLANVAQKEYKVPVCRTHPFLCGEEGLRLIRKDLAEDAVDALVIAACSPRMKTDAFSFDPRMVMERVNLREHVAWSHKAEE